MTPPWRRLNMADAIKEITGVDFDHDRNRRTSKSGSHRAGHGPGRSRGSDQRVRFWRKCLRNTVRMFRAIWTDRYLSSAIRWRFPPLSKRDPQDPRITRRFEAYINGWEIANAFSELNDPIDQYERFAEQQRQLDCGIDDEASARWIWTLSTRWKSVCRRQVVWSVWASTDVSCSSFDQPSIRDIMLFPTMKPVGLEKKGGAELKAGQNS